MDKTQNLQDVFLNTARRQHISVTLFLVNGVKLQGLITWFDNYSILLKRDGHIQLIYKHAVSTIMPATAIDLQEQLPDDTVKT
ncbi:MAG: RNA-binding protein Hfq [SAR116 cluster bacterium]|mgnify:FL=1|nr:MAG: RNA-binding protein Hfq [SAR116 cluster bacterium]|tara:strand:- start:553 stop:801 length:249 start_codon:yes stop_codon:yes gene_type:complete